MSGLAAQDLPAHDSLLWRAEDCIRDISGLPNTDQIALADASGAVSVIDINSASTLWSKFAHELGASLIDWCRDGELIASAGQDGYIKLWQPQTGEVVKVLQVPGLWVERLKWSPDGKYLAAAAGTSLVVWDRQGKEVLHYSKHISTVTSLAWKYNSKEIATACYKNVSLFKVGFNKPYQALKCLGSLITLAWSPNGKSICAGSQDRMLQYWHLGNNKNHHAEMKGYPEKVSALDWDSNSCFLASSGSKDIVVWKTQSKSPAGTEPQVLKGHNSRVAVICFQSQGAMLATGDIDGGLYVWDVAQSGFVVANWNLGSAITRLFWIDVDKKLVAGAKDGSVNLFDMSKLESQIEQQ